MAFSTFRGMKSFPQLMFSAFIILISFLIILILSVILAIPIFGIESFSNFNDLSNLNDPDIINLLKYFQVIQSIGLFIIPPFIIAAIFEGEVFKYLMLNKKTNINLLFLSILLVIFINPIINYLGALNAKMEFPEWLSRVENWMLRSEENAVVLTEAFLNVKTFSGLLFNLFMIAFLPAIGEELLFRGVIQKIFINWTKNNHLGIWISAILFSAMHLQFYGFIPRLLLGALFGYLLVWSGSMWLPILAHFINNGTAVIAMWMVDRGIINQEIEEIGATPESLYMAIISLILGILFIWLFKRQIKSNDEFAY